MLARSTSQPLEISSDASTPHTAFASSFTSFIAVTVWLGVQPFSCASRATCWILTVDRKSGSIAPMRAISDAGRPFPTRSTRSATAGNTPISGFVVYVNCESPLHASSISLAMVSIVGSIPWRSLNLLTTSNTNRVAGAVKSETRSFQAAWHCAFVAHAMRILSSSSRL